MNRTAQTRGLGSLAALASLVGLLCTVLIAGLATTQAGFSDRTGTTVNGDAGIGGTFDLGVRDGTAIVDAPDDASALEIAFTPAGEKFRIAKPLTYETTLVNRKQSVTGAVRVRLYDPDPVTNDLFAQLRFTMTIDDRVVATKLSAQAIEDLALAIDDVAPEAEHKVRLDVVLDPDISHDYHNTETQIGVRFEGVSTP
ncbi:hypothetical protein GCM10009847_17980 [Leucobacter tardus]|uniref:Uncharacterized protein n=1 Tax=Leucobacter tardus TaxID=501483 RepID=A0A939TS37_9MICO|nr:hypothetical protein [Leucobacter tardus]MBO2990687.1 hypothetical protein [Leucobacter tardus]